MTVSATLTKLAAGTAAAAFFTLAASGAASAWTRPTGTPQYSCAQNGTLDGGSTFTLYTNTFYDAGSKLYTTQYDLKNINDLAGLTSFTADFGYAASASPSDVLFFGDAPNKQGTVYHDGPLGKYGSTVANSGTVDYKIHPATMSATLQNNQLVWSANSGNALKAGQDMVSQLGYNGGSQYGSFGYLYIQSAAAPVQSVVTVKDALGRTGSVTTCAGSAPCSNTPPPAVPEPGAVASLGLGGIGLAGLLLRARKRGVKAG